MPSLPVVSALWESPKAPVLLCAGTDTIDADDALIRQIPGMENAEIVFINRCRPDPGTEDRVAVTRSQSLEKDRNGRHCLREYLSDLLKEKPEAVCVSGDLFAAYPVMHQLRKKHIPVLTASEQNGKRILVRIPSGS